MINSANNLNSRRNTPNWNIIKDDLSTILKRKQVKLNSNDVDLRRK